MSTQYSFCDSSFASYVCAFNFSLLFSTMITLLFHCLALFKMLRFYRAIKFENLVILGGAVECFVLIISTISFYDIFLEIGVAVQNLIELYIIRRLMRIIQRKNSNIKHPLYQTIFIILSSINIILLVSYIVIYQFTNLSRFANFILFVYVFYSHLVSVLFLYSGIKIKKIINTSLKESNEFDQVEIFYGTRMLQINTMIYSTLVCTGYIVIYTYLRLFLFNEQFEKKSFKSIPKSESAFWIHYLNLIANLIITMFNYISFYWLIRKQFINKKDLIENSSQKKTITLSLEEETTNGSTEMNKLLMDDTTSDIFAIKMDNICNSNTAISCDSSFSDDFSNRGSILSDK